MDIHNWFMAFGFPYLLHLGYEWKGEYVGGRFTNYGFTFGSILVSTSHLCSCLYCKKEKGVHCSNYLDDYGGAEVPEMAEQAFEMLGVTCSLWA